MPSVVVGAALGHSRHHRQHQFLHLEGWTKGNAWINGFPLGRYWSRRPQRSLYVPAPVLRPGVNDLILLELHGAASPTARLRDTADLGPTGEQAIVTADAVAGRIRA